MSNNNAQLFLKSHSGYDLFSVADPESLADLTIEDANFQNQFVILNNNKLKKSVLPKIPEDTAISLNLSELLNNNSAVYDIIRTGGSLGGASFSRDNETQEYTSIEVSMPVGKKANNAKFIDVNVKFVK